jgi:hypothetical protein
MRDATIRLVKLLSVVAVGALGLAGAPQPAAAVTPVFFGADYPAWLPLVASQSGKFVGFTVRVNSAGVAVDAQTISRNTEFGSEGVASCLGDPAGNVGYDIDGDSPLSVADDFRLACPFSRGDEIIGAVALVTRVAN